MKIEINAVKFKADEKLEEFIIDKASKLGKLFDQVVKCEVTLKVDKPESENNKIAEIRMHVPGNDLFVSKRADTFEEATDLAIDAIKKQLGKYKEKLKSK